MANTLVIIDSRVKDSNTLISQFQPDTEYLILNANRDGLQQVTERLAGTAGQYASIQIISHGTSGAITIGSTILSNTTLNTYQQELAIIGNSLTDNGDLLLYGCNVGTGEAGKQFVETLAQMTGADVAASDDVTGSAVFSGDWVLEVTSGEVNADADLGQDIIRNYSYILDPQTSSFATAREHLDYLLQIDFSNAPAADLAAISQLNGVVLNKNNFFDQDIDVFEFVSSIEKIAQIQHEFYLLDQDNQALFDYMAQADTAYYNSMQVTESFRREQIDIIKKDAKAGLWDYLSVNFAQPWEGISGVSKAMYDATIDMAGGFREIFKLSGATLFGASYTSYSDLVEKALDGIVLVEVTSFVNTLLTNTCDILDNLVQVFYVDSAEERIRLIIDISSSIEEIANKYANLKTIFTDWEMDEGLSAFADTVIALKDIEGIFKDIDALSDAANLSTLSGLSKDFLEDAVLVKALEGFDVAKDIIDILVPLLNKNPSFIGLASYLSEGGRTISDMISVSYKTEWNRLVPEFKIYEGFVPLVENYQTRLTSWLEHADELSNGAWGGNQDSVLPDIPSPVLPQPSLSLTITGLDEENLIGGRVNEGDFGENNFTIHITRSGDLSSFLLASYSYEFGTGINADDFVGGLPTAGNLVFEPDEITKSLILTIQGDELSESDEVVTFELDSQAHLNSVSKRIVIYSDDLIFQHGEGSLIGTSRKDHLIGSNSDDFIWAGPGNDIIEGGSGNDTVYGGSGRDVIVYQHMSNAVAVDLVNGSAFSGGKMDRFFSIEGVVGTSYDDHFMGSNGNETFEGGAGNDTIDGGYGLDTAVFSNAFSEYTVSKDLESSVVTVNQNSGGDGVDQLTRVEILKFSDVTLTVTQAYGEVIGSAKGDYLPGNDLDNRLDSRDGNDVLEGGCGDDTIIGGHGLDSVVFSGNFSDYAISYNSAIGSFTVIDQAGTDGTDLVSGVEKFQFADGMKTFSAVKASINVSSGISDYASLYPVNSSTQMFPGHTLGEWTNQYAFAALRADGSVVSWGLAWYGGDSGSVASLLNGDVDVTQIFSTWSAFAALRVDGSVVTWAVGWGGDSSGVASSLNGDVDVTRIFSTIGAFAALRVDGSVVTWGTPYGGGDSGSVASLLNGDVDVTQIFSTGSAFAALRADGSVVTWGSGPYGGDSSGVASSLNGDVDVTQIFSTDYAFAALRADGSVVTWAVGWGGGDSSGVASLLNGDVDVTQIFSTGSAFAALRADGSVVTWGSGPYGGDSSGVASSLNGDVDVTQIFSAGYAFAALRADGSVVTWGDSYWGGDSGGVASSLNGDVDVTQIFSTEKAFAALRADGSVVSWGNNLYGGDSSSVASLLNGDMDVTQIFSTDYAFAALRADGSVVTWGDSSCGGDSSGAADKLVGVVDISNIYTNSTGDQERIGSQDNDDLQGNLGSDILWGYDGDDELAGMAGDDLMFGGDGNDMLIGGEGEGNDTYDGGAGDDTVKYNSALAGITVDLSEGAAFSTDGSDAAGIGEDTLIDIENIIAGNFDDLLIGNDKPNSIEGGSGNDTLAGGEGADTLDGGAGSDTADYSDKSVAVSVVLNGTTDAIVSVGGIAEDAIRNIENLIGGSGNDHFVGDAAANRLSGNDGDDLLQGGAGNDTIIGGYDDDTVVLSGDFADYLFTYDKASGSYTVTDGVAGRDGVDTVIDVEHFRFADVEKPVADLIDIAAPLLESVTPAGYAVNVPVENNIVLTFSEMIKRGTGIIEIHVGSEAGTVVESFDAATSNRLNLSDTMLTIDPTEDLARGTQYYITITEGSIKDLVGNSYAGLTSYNFTTETDPSMVGGSAESWLYLASWPDLMAAFGADSSLAAWHYNTYGKTEGRTLTFDAWGYLASWADLRGAFGTNLGAAAEHYVEYGRNEGRTLTFDAWGYLASWADLRGAFGTDLGAVTRHYVEYGANEGRTLTFDAWNYLASYDDLLNTFGTDLGAATRHYVAYGANEGRTLSFDTEGYLLSYDDLHAAFGTDTHAAILHYVSYGYHEGRHLVSVEGAPVVSSFSPVDGTAGAALDSNIILTFNESIHRSSGNIELHVGSPTGALVESYDVTTSTHLTVSGTTLTINPTADLARGTRYFVTITAGAVKDLFGDSYAGTTSYDFISDPNLIGTEGMDMLHGGSGNEMISALGGTDTLNGGAGADLLIGGEDDDTFVFSSASDIGLAAGSRDVISDFTSGQDRIDLSSIDANSGMAENQAFSSTILGGSGVFSSAGQLRYDSVAGVLYGNTDSDAEAEFAIQLLGLVTLNAGDLVL